MSTKVTISYDKEYHLYQEIFDVSNVYLQVSGHEFEATNKQVMVQIPIKAFRSMIKAWEKSGWPESEDNSEKKIVDDWGDSLLRNYSTSKNSDETIIFKKEIKK
jgi:hypothetical protein